MCARRVLPARAFQAVLGGHHAGAARLDGSFGQDERSTARAGAPAASRTLAHRSTDAYSDSDLADIAYTLQVGREALDERLAFTATTSSYKSLSDDSVYAQGRRPRILGEGQALVQRLAAHLQRDAMSANRCPNTQSVEMGEVREQLARLLEQLLVRPGRKNHQAGCSGVMAAEDGLEPRAGSLSSTTCALTPPNPNS